MLVVFAGRISPQKSDRIIRRVVLQNQRKGTLSETELGIRAGDLGMSIFNRWIVITVS